LEEEPDVSTVARSGAFHGHRNVNCPAGLDERSNVLLPGGLIEVDGEEPARLILQQWVDSHNVTTSQVVENHLVVHRCEGLVWALAELDLREIANPANELILTGRC